jgi:hypothetical protein
MLSMARLAVSDDENARRRLCNPSSSHFGVSRKAFAALMLQCMCLELAQSRLFIAAE